MLRHNSGTLARIATVSIMIYLSCTLVFVPPCQDLHDRSLQHMHAMHVCVLLKFVCLKCCMLRKRVWLTHDCLRPKLLLQMPVHTKLIFDKKKVSFRGHYIEPLYAERKQSVQHECLLLSGAIANTFL